MVKPDLRDVLADNVVAFRRRTKVSQDEFAAMCGLHRTYVGAIERKERNVTLATLELLADAIGCSASELLKRGGVK